MKSVSLVPRIAFAVLFSIPLLAGAQEPATATPVQAATDQVIVDALAEKLARLQAPSKEISTGCTTVPLPTTPVGPTYSIQVNDTGFGTSTRFAFDVWRKSCSANDAQMLITLRPTHGTAGLGGGSFAVRQGSRSFLTTMVTDEAFRPFSGPLSQPTTVMLRYAGPGATFDDDAALDVVWLGLGADFTVSLPAATFNTPPAPYRIGVDSGGVFYDPQMAGHGLTVAVLPESNRIVGTWFTTALDGSDRLDWFTLNGTFEHHSAELAILRVRGHRWPERFTGTPETVGVMFLDYVNCREMSARLALFEGAHAREYSQRLVRIVPTPECP